MLSIIIPHYNTPKKLRRLLNTIPIRDDVEVIIIDDNSNNSLDEFDRLSNDFSKHLFLKNYRANKGAGSCRNIGLEKANGDWILFADADDYFQENFYEIVSKYFNSSYDLVYFLPTSIQEDTNEISTRHNQHETIIRDYLENLTIDKELKLRYEIYAPWNKLIRMNLIKNNSIMFDEVMVANDVMFSTLVGYYASSITASEDIIYCVTESSGTLTKTLTKKNFDTRLSVRIKRCLFLKKRLDPKELKVVDTSGREAIVNVLTYKLGFRELINTYVKLKKNRIEVLEVKYFNPIILCKKIRKVYWSHKENQKYIVK